MPTELKGANALRKALKQFSPDLDKETRDEMVGFLKPLVKKARGFMPSNAASLIGVDGCKQYQFTIKPQLELFMNGQAANPMTSLFLFFPALLQVKDR